MNETVSILLPVLAAALVLAVVVYFMTRKHPANGPEIPKPKPPILEQPKWPPPIVHPDEPPDDPPIVIQPPVVVNPRKDWPNAPGYPVLLDPGTTRAEYSDVLWNTRGLVTFTPDGMLFKYPKGYGAGEAPGTPYKMFPKPVKQVYVGQVMKFSPRWENHEGSGVSKILYLFSGNGGSIPIIIYGTRWGPFFLRMYPQLRVFQDPKLVQAVPFLPDQYGDDAWLKHGWLISNISPMAVPIGEDFLLEVRINTTGQSVTEWFLNGKPQGLYLGVTYPPEGLDSLKEAAVWGGVGGAKTQDDYILVKSVHVEGR